MKICISRTFVGVLRKYENLEMQLLAKSVWVFDLSTQFVLLRHVTMPANFASVVFHFPRYLIDSVSAICSV